MSQWRRVAQSSDLNENTPLVIELDADEAVLLTRRNRKLSAIGNTCPHYGGPLGDGVFHHGHVVCPYHNAMFSLDGGTLERSPALDGPPVYDVKEENGSIFLGDRHDRSIAMPHGDDDRRVLIVGSGAAGSACAETLRREGFAGWIVMVTADEEAPYDRPMLSKGLISGDSPAKYLPLRPPSFYDSLGIEVVTGTRIDRLDPNELTVTTADGKRMTADMVLLATGGVPRRLDLPGADLEGVYTLRSHRDAEAIIAACEDASDAVVLGAGFIGMEVAAQLRQRGLSVCVVDPVAEPLEPVLGPEMGAWMRSIHEEEGTTFRMKHKPELIAGERGARQVRLDDGSTLPADLVVYGVGVDPRVDYLRDTGLIDGSLTRGVRVDQRLSTAFAGLYAAGDIAVYPGLHDEHRVEHWVHAQEQGRHVARAMLGSDEPYRRLPFFWTRQHGTTLKYYGFPGHHDSTRSDGSPGDGEFITGYFRSNRLVAIAAYGRSEKLELLSAALERGETISPDDFVSA